MGKQQSKDVRNGKRYILQDVLIVHMHICSRIESESDNHIHSSDPARNVAYFLLSVDAASPGEFLQPFCPPLVFPASVVLSLATRKVNDTIVFMTKRVELKNTTTKKLAGL